MSKQAVREMVAPLRTGSVFASAKHLSNLDGKIRREPVNHGETLLRKGSYQVRETVVLFLTARHGVTRVLNV
jgi:hypothetical protein